MTSLLTLLNFGCWLLREMHPAVAEIKAGIAEVQGSVDEPPRARKP